MKLSSTTVKDQIPWDTCVIALIFGVFKTEFKKGTVIRFKMRCVSSPPLNPQYNHCDVCNVSPLRDGNGHAQ